MVFSHLYITVEIVFFTWKVLLSFLPVKILLKHHLYFSQSWTHTHHAHTPLTHTQKKHTRNTHAVVSSFWESPCFFIFFSNSPNFLSYPQWSPLKVRLYSLKVKTVFLFLLLQLLIQWLAHTHTKYWVRICYIEEKNRDCLENTELISRQKCG